MHNLYDLEDFGNGDDWVHDSVNDYYGINILVHWIELSVIEPILMGK